MDDATPAIEIDAAWAGYGGPPILEDVNVRIEDREFVGVVGPNGGGKTTFLKLILGLVSPARGRVRVFGTTPARARPRIGYVPQRTDFDQAFPIRAEDVVRMGRLGHDAPLGPWRKSDRMTAEAALQTVGIAHLRHAQFGSLSGGQQQRVLIARALAATPRMLLLDEPMSNLDQPAEKEMYEILNRLNQRMTIVLVSHDISVVTGQVERVVCVNRRVLVHRTAEITDAALLTVYGGDMRIVRHDEHCGEEEHP
jgi:zinc transport system ATP-binding protein